MVESMCNFVHGASQYKHSTGKLLPSTPPPSLLTSSPVVSFPSFQHRTQHFWLTPLMLIIKTLNNKSKQKKIRNYCLSRGVGECNKYQEPSIDAKMHELCGKIVSAH